MYDDYFHIINDAIRVQINEHYIRVHAVECRTFAFIIFDTVLKLLDL